MWVYTLITRNLFLYYDKKHFRTFQSSAAQGTPCANVIKFKKTCKNYNNHLMFALSPFSGNLTKGLYEVDKLV